MDSVITIETTERGDKVYTSVKDYGIGIPRKSLNKIWERFYKTDLSRGKDKKGTGLGLAIVKEIIRAHNQNINVISTEGVGTEFIFTLEKRSENLGDGRICHPCLLFPIFSAIQLLIFYFQSYFRKCPSSFRWAKSCWRKAS